MLRVSEKGDSIVTGRQKDRRKMGVGKRGFWIALNSLTGEEIFQKIRLSPGGIHVSTIVAYRNKEHNNDIFGDNSLGN